ncbi:MAG: hypothetical protein JSR54_10155 [Proteobacteria bacterium]|nr:hypothetical protein [Pseudomonadota bacterium]
MGTDVELSSGQRTTTITSLAAHPCAVHLDTDVHAWFEGLALRSGSDLAALVNAVLRDHVHRAGEPLERTLRRVLREELRKAG